MPTIAEITPLDEAAFRYVREQRELRELRLIDLHTWFCEISSTLIDGESYWVPWDRLLEIVRSSNEEYGTKDVLKVLLGLMFEQLKEAIPYLNFEFDKEREGITLYPSIIP